MLVILSGLTVLEALHSIHGVTLDQYFKHYMRILTVFREGIQYGTKDFQEYIRHRQVMCQSKSWLNLLACPYQSINRPFLFRLALVCHIYLAILAPKITHPLITPPQRRIFLFFKHAFI
jgi:hypothetical protein